MDEARGVGLAGGVVAGRFCLTGSFAFAGSADLGLSNKSKIFLEDYKLIQINKYKNR